MQNLEILYMFLETVVTDKHLISVIPGSTVIVMGTTVTNVCKYDFLVSCCLAIPRNCRITVS